VKSAYEQVFRKDVEGRAVSLDMQLCVTVGLGSTLPKSVSCHMLLPSCSGNLFSAVAKERICYMLRTVMGSENETGHML
jgi:hypothetical protein